MRSNGGVGRVSSLGCLWPGGAAVVAAVVVGVAGIGVARSHDHVAVDAAPAEVVAPVTVAQAGDPAVIDGVPVDTIGDRNPRATGATVEDATEMPITDLLNRVSQAGYAEYRSITRDEDVYRIEAIAPDFRPVVLEVDVVTGTISEVN